MPYTAEQRREWYLANRDRILREKKEQYRMNPTIKRDYQRKYRADNSEKVRNADRARGEVRRADDEYRRKQNEKAREWYQKNRAYVSAKNREMRLVKNYGMTEADYVARLSMQQGVCAICRKPPVENTRLAVDHCHETGIVRGLLCDGCNQAIGRLGDNSESVNRAVSYLAAFENSLERASA